MYAVRRPTARLHLIRVQSPELQLLLKQRATHIGGIMQLSRSARCGKEEEEEEKTQQSADICAYQTTRSM